ncbi:unnamed protein product [Peronospora farinosa]|uniref:Uncharacterized protein n=1 Tax=Peronospora farinosa TaxID=134698 RepID=A0AAV0T9A7_9STRA|nr:unnamed protein product [Peronospora farinosa]
MMIVTALIACADIFKGLHITNWMKYVRDLYVDSPEVATKAMLKLLTRHFTNDHALASALVPGMNGNKDEEAVFKLLKLDETNDNVFNSPVFSQWVDFVEKRSNSQEEAYDMMLDRLSSDFKSKNALYKKWVEETKNADDVFSILELSPTEQDLFKNPAFSGWVGFVKSTSSNDLKAIETMLSTLKLDGKKGTKKEIKKLESVTQRLKKALIKKSPEPPKRQNNFDLNEPPAKRQKEFDST